MCFRKSYHTWNWDICVLVIHTERIKAPPFKMDILMLHPIKQRSNKKKCLKKWSLFTTYSNDALRQSNWISLVDIWNKNSIALILLWFHFRYHFFPKFHQNEHVSLDSRSTSAKTRKNVLLISFFHFPEEHNYVSVIWLHLHKMHFEYTYAHSCARF